MARYLTLEQTLEARELCHELPVIADRLARAGLYETYQLMIQGPLQRIGHELEQVAHWNDPARIIPDTDGS